MTEQPDYLGLGDADDRRARQDPGLIVSPPLGARELIAAEQMHRKDDLEACNRLMFVGVADDGTETLEEPLVWQRVMKWPREPSIAEVEAFRLNAKATRAANWWSKLAEAKAADEAEAAQPPPAVERKPLGAIKGRAAGKPAQRP